MKLSLHCPLSRIRLRVPARSVACRHLADPSSNPELEPELEPEPEPEPEPAP